MRFVLIFLLFLTGCQGFNSQRVLDLIEKQDQIRQQVDTVVRQLRSGVIDPDAATRLLAQLNNELMKQQKELMDARDKGEFWGRIMELLAAAGISIVGGVGGVRLLRGTPLKSGSGQQPNKT